MNLLIDLSEKDEIRLALFDEKKNSYKIFSGQNRELIYCLEEMLKENNLKKEQISAIAVVVGSGSFTSTRIAVTVANTFGYILNIPLLAIDENDAKDYQLLICKLKKQPLNQYISATYSAEPNIT